MRSWAWACLAVAAASWLSPAIAVGNDFRVVTRVRVGDASEPVSENLTLFVGDRIYDFLETQPRKTIVLDPQIGQLDLLDHARKRRTSLSTEDLLRLVAAIKVRVLSNERIDPVVRFAASPQFKESYDEQKKQLSLRSRLMTYEATALTATAERTGRYRAFCDWISRLNSTRPGALPPFARLRLNEQLSTRGLVPAEISLTLAPRQAGASPTVLHSEHEFSAPLTDADRKRVEATRVQLDQWQWVSWSEYCGAK